MVAFSTLCGLFVPSVLVRMSWTPAASSTGRTAPPAMTPVPCDGRLQEHARRPEVAGDLAGDRRVLERHEDQVLLGVLDRLADRLRHLVRLAESDAHVTAAVAHHHEGGEGEPPAALDDLGHPVDGDHPVVQVQRAGIDLASATQSARPIIPRPSTRTSESAGACRVGQRLHPPVILVAAAVEHHVPDARAPSPAAPAARPPALAAATLPPRAWPGAELGCAAVHRDERAARLVVDDLGVDVIQAAEHRQPRPLRRCPAPSAARGRCRFFRGPRPSVLVSITWPPPSCRPCGGCTRPRT